MLTCISENRHHVDSFHWETGKTRTPCLRKKKKKHRCFSSVQLVFFHVSSHFVVVFDVFLMALVFGLFLSWRPPFFGSPLTFDFVHCRTGEGAREGAMDSAKGPVGATSWPPEALGCLGRTTAWNFPQNDGKLIS